MTPRSIRRAAERKALKQARKAARQFPNNPPREECGTGSADLSAHTSQPTTPPSTRELAAVPVPAFLPTPNPSPVPPPLSEKQLTANRANAALSTGPTTPEGKIRSAQNSRSHGLSSSSIRFLADENGLDYIALANSIYTEHHPETDTEQRLADLMVQSWWLMQRALRLQQNLLSGADLDTKKMSLFLRYQTTHERSYYRALRELKAVQKERRKHENGFVSQNQTEASPQAETARLESLHAKTRLQNARALTLEVDAACRKVMEIPLPGNTTLSFEELTKVCSTAIAAATTQKRLQMEAAAA